MWPFAWNTRIKGNLSVSCLKILKLQSWTNFLKHFVLICANVCSPTHSFLVTSPLLPLNSNGCCLVHNVVYFILNLFSAGMPNVTFSVELDKDRLTFEYDLRRMFFFQGNKTTFSLTRQVLLKKENEWYCQFFDTAYLRVSFAWIHFAAVRFSLITCYTLSFFRLLLHIQFTTIKVNERVFEF